MAGVLSTVVQDFLCRSYEGVLKLKKAWAKESGMNGYNDSCPQPQILLNLVALSLTGAESQDSECAVDSYTCCISLGSIICSWPVTSRTLAGTASSWHWSGGITHAATVHIRDVITAQSLWFPQLLPLQWLTWECLAGFVGSRKAGIVLFQPAENTPRS